MTSPTTTQSKSSSGEYSNYYKAEKDAKASPKNYNLAKTAISKALADGGYPADWLQPVLELVARESSFDPNNKNPKSSAAGLFQFLDSTRRNYGGSKVNWKDPYQQAVQGLRYIKDKYSNPVKALQFWDEKKAEGNAWY